MAKTPLQTAVEGLIAPALGDFLAEAKMTGVLGAIGASELDSSKLGEVADLLEKNLALSLGPVAATELAQKIRSMG